MGLGLGGLIDANNTSVDGLTYLQFVAPGLMAATAMQLAAAESHVAGHGRHASGSASTTPWWRHRSGPSDIFDGHLGWQAMRLAMGGAAFLIVAAILGALASPLGDASPSPPPC